MKISPIIPALISLVWYLTRSFSSDGIRIDSAKHVEPSFYSGFSSAAGVFAIGEVYNGDPAYLAPYQRYMDGVLDYAG